MNKVKVVLFLGGNSSEREVSLKSGEAVYQALKDNQKFEITKIDPSTDLEKFEKMVADDNVDLAFLALHGAGYEDGQFQNYLDKLGVKYTGADSQASEVGFDKMKMKKVWYKLGLPVALDILLVKTQEGWAIGSTDMEEASLVKNLEDLKTLTQQIVDGYFTFPLFIKPAKEGSSVGVYMVKNKEELVSKIDLLISKYSEIIIECKLSGKEVTVPFFYNRDLDVIEILSGKEEFYNFESKYSQGGSTHILPARINQNVMQELKDAVRTTLKTLKINSYCRVDAFVDGDKFWLTEINTLPGMTGTSLLPEAVAKSGLTFSQMCEMMIIEDLKK